MLPLVSRSRFQVFFKVQSLTALEMSFLGLLSSTGLLPTTEACFVRERESMHGLVLQGFMGHEVILLVKS